MAGGPEQKDDRSMIRTTEGERASHAALLNDIDRMLMDMLMDMLGALVTCKRIC